MIITICILAYFIVTLIIALIYVCYVNEFTIDEWLGIMMFVLCPPLWFVICKIAQAIRHKRNKKRRYKYHEKLL